MHHFGDILRTPWHNAGIVPATSWCCLKPPPEDNGMWLIQYPTVDWDKNQVVILHLQDFVNVDSDGIRELHMIEQHYGNRANRVVVVHWNWTIQSTYNGPLHLVYFDSHEYEILENLAQMSDQWQPQLLQPRSRVWQCLNGVPRPHRRRAVQSLGRFKGTVSLGDEITLHDWPYHTSYAGTTNEQNYLRLLPLYADHDINIVTETQYQYRPGIITEKTFFAWISLQVPVLIGYPGMVQDSKDMGFDVFEDIVETSYDWSDNSMRVEQAVDLNADLLTHGIDRGCLQDRLLANQHHALHVWPQQMIQNYQCRVTEILSSLTTA